MADTSPNLVAILTTIVSLLIAYLTIVRWTRDSREQAIHDLKTQFWIEHSVDLPYAVGALATPDQSETRLVVRGLEIYEYGWYLELGQQFDPYPWRSDPQEAFRMWQNVLKAHLKKFAYYLYRTFVPFASLKMDCSLLIEAQNCCMTVSENVESFTDGSIHYSSGTLIHEEIDLLTGFSPLWDDLYKLTFDTYDYKKADDAMHQLITSEFVKDLPEQDTDLDPAQQ